MKGILCWANAGGGKLLRYRMKDGETKTVGTLHRMGTGYTGWFDESPPWVYCFFPSSANDCLPYSARRR